MWNHCKVEQVERIEQACTKAGVWSQWRSHLESLGESGEHTAPKSNLSRHLWKLEVLPTSKALKLYTTLSSTLTTNCFAPMFKQKLDICMMNRDDRLRRFSWNVNKLTFNVKQKKNHAFAANDFAWHVQTIKYKPKFLYLSRVRT